MNAPLMLRCARVDAKYYALYDQKKVKLRYARFFRSFYLRKVK